MSLADWINVFGPGVVLVALVRALWRLTGWVFGRLDRWRAIRRLERHANQPSTLTDEQPRKEKP